MIDSDSRESQLAGVRHMLLAAFWFSLMSLAVKLAGQRLPSSEIVLARSAFSLVVTWAMLRRARIRPWGKRPGLLLLRGLAGFGGLVCFFHAITRLPLGDVTVIHFTNPVFTAVLAAVFLGESLAGRELLGLLTSLVGVTLVAQPQALFGAGARSLDLPAVGIGLAGAFFAAIAYTIVRNLRRSEHHLVVVFYFTIVATPAAIPLSAAVAVWPTPTEWIMLLGVGLATQVAQIYLTRGLHAIPAGRAMSVSYVQILFAVAWGALFFGELPNALAVLGAVLVIVGTLVVSTGGRRGQVSTSPMYRGRAETGGLNHGLCGDLTLRP